MWAPSLYLEKKKMRMCLPIIQAPFGTGGSRVTALAVRVGSGHKEPSSDPGPRSRFGSGADPRELCVCAVLLDSTETATSSLTFTVLRNALHAFGRPQL